LLGAAIVITSHWIWRLQCSGMQCCVALWGVGGCRFIRNINDFLPQCMASQSTAQWSFFLVKVTDTDH
jgi:hypothetical protein